jgi:hypothetical protein
MPLQYCILFQIIYMTNHTKKVTLATDRPVTKNPNYLGFAGVFFAAAFLGDGGVASIFRSTSVGFGSGSVLRFMDGV